MNMISEMNKNILINEFTQLKNSLILPQDILFWLEEFLKEEEGEKRKFCLRTILSDILNTPESVSKKEVP